MKRTVGRRQSPVGRKRREARGVRRKRTVGRRQSPVGRKRRKA